MFKFCKKKSIKSQLEELKTNLDDIQKAHLSMIESLEYRIKAQNKDIALLQGELFYLKYPNGRITKDTYNFSLPSFHKITYYYTCNNCTKSIELGNYTNTNMPIKVQNKDDVIYMVFGEDLYIIVKKENTLTKICKYNESENYTEYGLTDQWIELKV